MVWTNFIMDPFLVFAAASRQIGEEEQDSNE
jgi:hypothetical protein